MQRHVVDFVRVGYFIPLNGLACWTGTRLVSTISSIVLKQTDLENTSNTWFNLPNPV